MALHYLAIAAALALLLWLVVPRAVDQVDQALGGVPTSQLELNQKAKHSTGIKHEFFVGMQKRLQKLPSAGSVVHGAVTVGTKALEALIGVFFVFATAAYWIFERERAIDLVTSMMARKHRKTVHDTWELIDAKLGAFVRGQLLLVTFVATVLSLSFWAIGMPFWLLLGVFAGIVEVVPVIGPLLAGAFAVGVGLTVSWHLALFAGIIVLVVRQVEDYVVIPRVMGHVTGLSPLLVLVSVSTIGLLLGGFYVLLATPLGALDREHAHRIAGEEIDVEELDRVDEVADLALVAGDDRRGCATSSTRTVLSEANGSSSCSISLRADEAAAERRPPRSPAGMARHVGVAERAARPSRAPR